MACFKFPVSLCTQLNGILANFWWGNQDSNGLHWKSWDFLCLAKKDGGLENHSKSYSSLGSSSTTTILSVYFLSYCQKRFFFVLDLV
ncbi:hypothetical protein RchiOBHm_Chr1g0327801 [Rosa chinensis]|uniref:Uncharacterized protein n=1 Tax=Rosa chinensis TaxID=74649 RepID=A0A2P6SAP0_ROSCH|nr:hypothetical protein RchiOBHm_Chr1g0327801 [Rosa chinensis]